MTEIEKTGSADVLKASASTERMMTQGALTLIDPDQQHQIRISGTLSEINGIAYELSRIFAIEDLAKPKAKRPNQHKVYLIARLKQNGYGWNTDQSRFEKEELLQLIHFSIELISCVQAKNDHELSIQRKFLSEMTPILNALSKMNEPAFYMFPEDD